MTSGKFCLVKFKDSQDLASVPSSWFSEELCHLACAWPCGPKAHGRKLAKMVAKVEDSWPKYPCEVLHTFDTYEATRKKERLLESFQDSHKPLEIPQQQRKRRRKHSSSEDEQEKSCSSSFLVNNEVACSSSVVGLPDVSSSVNPDDCEEEEGDQVSNDVNILQRLERLEKTCSNIQKDVRQILDFLQAQSSSKTTPLESLDVVENYLPLSNLPALYELETNLSDSLERREEMRIHLQQLGGSSTDEMVKRMLRHIFTDDLAQHFSWLGQKGKHKLCDLFLMKAIFHAVETSRMKGTRERTENRIREWFRQAGTRSKYLIERQSLP